MSFAASPSSRAPRRPVAVALVAALVLVGVVWLGAGRSNAAGEVYTVPPSGSWSVQGAGYGHGIGMSQWGAQGAALSGLRPDQILGFYYPGTTFGNIGNPNLRVQLTDYQGPSIVFGAYGGETLTATDTANGQVQQLPKAARYRLTMDATWFYLSAQNPDGSWAPLTIVGQTTIGGPIEINGPSGFWAYSPDLSGAGRQYWGTLRMIRTTGTTAQAINVLPFDAYLKFVVPRESPAWYEANALQAQAVAARSYAKSVSTPSAKWDICDTTQCQVYGGRAVAAAGGATTWLEAASTSNAVDGTSGIVLVDSAGAVAFTQFSSSNGGYSVAGSKPYLVAKEDPYSGKDPKDTATRWTDTLQASVVQGKCPSGTLQSFEITGRDGKGPFGGRITSIKVNCTGGSATVTNITDLAFGMKHRMWQVVGAGTGGGGGGGGQPVKTGVIGNLESIAGSAGGIRIKGWASGNDASSAEITVVYLKDRVLRIHATGNRPDVAKVHPDLGPAHGFDFIASAPQGTTLVCVYAGAAGGYNQLGCKNATSPAGAPFGHLDEVTAAPGDGSNPPGIVARGWVIDPNTGDPIAVHLYYASGATPTTANQSRPDVGKVFPSSGANHGFSQRIAVPPGSSGELCAYAINVPAPADNPMLGCLAYTAPVV
jgi:SpoIID/LytB domain protein